MKRNKKVETISLQDGDSLASVIKELHRRGIEDFSKVMVQMEFHSCPSCSECGEYNDCDPSYYDPRLEWETKE